MIVRILDFLSTRMTVKEQCDGPLKLAYSLRFRQSPSTVRTVDVFNYFWGLYDDAI